VGSLLGKGETEKTWTKKKAHCVLKEDPVATRTPVHPPEMENAIKFRSEGEGLGVTYQRASHEEAYKGRGGRGGQEKHELEEVVNRE